MNMNCDEVRGNLGAYALNALDAAERASLAQHLEACPSCMAKLLQHQLVAQGLLFAVPDKGSTPAVSMIKTRLLAEIAKIPQRNYALPPQRTTWQRFWDWLTGRLGMPRWAFAVLSVLSIVTTGLLGVQTMRYARLFSQHQQAVALLADAEARAVRLEGQKSTPNAWATLRYRQDSTVGLMNVGDLPTQTQKSYQLWLVDAQGKRDSGAVFMTQMNGKASYVVIAPRQFSSYVRFGVSIEPAGGSPGPTGPAALLSAVQK